MTYQPTQHLGANQKTTLLGTGTPTLRIDESGIQRDIVLSSTPMTIGRLPDNAIQLASLFISGTHARIDPDGQAHRIIDLNSTNGLLYQGTRLLAQAPHSLVDGDVIRIGDPVSGNFVTLTYINPTAIHIPQLSPVILPESGAALMFGRIHGGGIWNNPQVSRNHAVIEGQPDGTHRLRDLGSTNGTYVNGQRIVHHTLQRGDLVQIGPFKLTYDGVALVQQDRRSAMRIEARQLKVERLDPDAHLLDHLLALLRIRPIPQKIILRDVSLCIEPGQFVALVGGSGAGKSTLMGALSGFARATSGSVLVNGEDYYQHFDAYRPVLGYVPQDDIVHRALPVSRALTYAARLRLPEDTAPDEITHRITDVLRDVEMTEHRSKQIDHLSGGQRKRISIASELLADPALFYLDEPTSGLDPGLEKKMMYTLRKLADKGHTIVLVTHATANIHQCDMVAFMSAGRLVYYGPPSEAPLFFGVTTSDFADIYTRIEGRFDPGATAFTQDQEMQQAYQQWQLANPNAKALPLLAELWEPRFRSSQYYQHYVRTPLEKTIAPISASIVVQPTPTAMQKKVSAWQQFLLLSGRYLDLVIQDRRNLIILLLQAPAIAALLAFVAKPDAVIGGEASFASARPVMFMLATVAVWFGIINAAREITKEVPIYRRERLAGLLIVPYVLSKVVVLTILVLIQSLVLLWIITARVTMPKIGLIGSVGIDLFITTFLASLAGLALGLLISTLASTPDRAISIVPLALIPQIVLSGVIFRLEGIAQTLSWLAIGRWAMDAYGAIIDLNGLPQLVGQPPVSPRYDEYTHEPGHLAIRWLIMLFYTVICLGLTMWQLHRKNAQQ